MLPAHALAAARTIDRATGLAQTQAAPAPRQRRRAPFLLQNALPALLARSHANWRREQICEGEMPPGPVVLTTPAEGAPPARHSHARPSALKFREFLQKAKGLAPAAGPNALLLLLGESK